MQLFAAIIIAVALALPASAQASSEASNSKPDNPIIWLINDISALLTNVTSGEKSTPAAQEKAPQPAKTETPPEATTASLNDGKDTKVAFKNPIKALFDDLARLFNGGSSPSSNQTEAPIVAEDTSPAQRPVADQTVAVAVEPAPTSQPTEASAQRNPIQWLFSDLANLLTPTLEIDDNPAPHVIAQTPKEVEPAPASVMTAVAPAADDDAQASDQKIAEVSDAPQPAKEFRDPVSWMLSDLATLFAPQGSTAPLTEAPVLTTADDTPVVAEAAVAEMASAPETNTTPNETTASLVVESAPWTQKTSADIFDPSDNIFSKSSAPVITARTTSAPIEVAEGSTPSLRQRPPYRPEARNYRTLGHDHKSVTPDPEDDDVVASVLEKIFSTDVSSETLANKISERIVPEESLDLKYTSPDAPDQNNERTFIGDGRPLMDLDLYLGQNKTIGRPFDRANLNSAACIERTLQGSVFCLEDLNWPASEQSNFSADTSFILPGEGVIRYENGASSRIYAVFNASRFAEVIKLMQRRFGPPQEREIGWMHILEAPKLPNTTFRWKAVTPDRADTIVLEVRNYDDIRRSFADMDHGMIRLFRSGSRPIFKHISTMDLMLMQRRSAAQASAAPKTQQK